VKKRGIHPGGGGAGLFVGVDLAYFWTGFEALLVHWGGDGYAAGWPASMIGMTSLGQQLVLSKNQ